MYIHNEIQKAVLPLLKKYDLQLIDLIGEINHAAFELSVLNSAGIKKLIASFDADTPDTPDRTMNPEHP